MGAIQSIIAIQAGLIEALDARDVGRIESATKDLARAIGQIRNRGGMVVGGGHRDDLGHALKQTEALKTRVNFMALRNRERLEKLGQMRGAAAPHVYANRRNTGSSRPLA